jgi:hypothetical protein
MHADQMIKIIIAISLTVLTGCSNPKSSTHISENHAASTTSVISDSGGRTTAIASVATIKPVKYEILREPNGGSGVFDFMYIVCVNGNITNDQAKWIFDDIIRQKGGSKIAIDIWSNKRAFNEILKIYQKEDKVFAAGGNMKEFAKERDKVTAKYDKYNIAQYTNNGVDISTKYPQDN